jgi:hypothetical protein
MNKIKMNFALVAIVLGTTFGVATAGTYVQPTLYYDCTTASYQPITPGNTVICDNTEPVFCKATGTVATPVPIENDEIGCGTLVPIPLN